MDYIDILFIGLTWIGTAILFWRVIPRCHKDSDNNKTFEGPWPKVSIVIPARNEEKNMSRLLSSLTNLSYPNYEVIVVDDQSTDQTRAIAESYGVRIIESEPPPSGWNGKNWACHQAIPYLSGEIYLFSDADTEHDKEGLRKAVAFFLNSKANMMSSLPYHRVEKKWEKLLGPFYTILLAATAPYSPRPKRLFAIGQYLMFSRESYADQGGHKAVFNQYPDDLALANACLEKDGRFLIYMGKPLFRVRMYATLKEFILGWRRNFLAGLQQSNLMAPLEVFLIFCGITGSGRIFFGWEYFIPAGLCALLIVLYQKKWGEFTFFGVLLTPVSLILFCLCTGLAIADYCRGNVLQWKGRRYTNWVTKVKAN